MKLCYKMNRNQLGHNNFQIIDISNLKILICL